VRRAKSAARWTRGCAYRANNWVRFHARFTGDLDQTADAADAAVAAVARYNEIVDAFTHAPPSPLASVLSSLVDGNIDAHLDLARTRFPGAAERTCADSAASPQTIPEGPTDTTTEGSIGHRELRSITQTAVLNRVEIITRLRAECNHVGLRPSEAVPLRRPDRLRRHGFSRYSTARPMSLLLPAGPSL